MLQIMVEAFAKSLINKIMLEAFDIADAQHEKLQMPDSQEEPKPQSQATRATLQMYERSCTDCNESETTELIEKMVHGLHNIQIGDNALVSPPLSKLEKQVKHVICNISNVALADPNAAETRIAQGQGDVHQAIHGVVTNTPTDATCARKEKENCNTSEATRVSVSLLHRMIEELEMETEEPKMEPKQESISKGKIAVWEETEEKFIRTIESVDTEQNNITCSSESGSHNHVSDFVRKASSTSLPAHSKPMEKDTYSEEIKSQAGSPVSSSKDNSTLNLDRNLENCLDESKLQSQKKKGVLTRIRKTLRHVFGRRKQ